MENAPSVSASELIGGNPPQKKSRPPLPPGFTVKPVYAGASYGIHPVDKMGIKLTDAKLLETPLPAGSKPPKPEPPPTIPLPPLPPDPDENQLRTEPCATCGRATVGSAGETCGECKAKSTAPNPSGPAPDFSDLPKSESEPAPGGEHQEQAQPSEAELLTAYEQMGAMFWDSVIRLMAALFGDFWLPKTADERKMVLDALTGWMKSVAFAAFTPIQNLWMAIGLYSMPRMPKTFQQIIAWWKSRKNKKQPQTERKDYRAKDEPIETHAEVMKGPFV
jgi:hypothetical protein